VQKVQRKAPCLLPNRFNEPFGSDCVCRGADFMRIAWARRRRRRNIGRTNRSARRNVGHPISCRQIVSGCGSRRRQSAPDSRPRVDWLSERIRSGSDVANSCCARDDRRRPYQHHGRTILSSAGDVGGMDRSRIGRNDQHTIRFDQLAAGASRRPRCKLCAKNGRSPRIGQWRLLACLAAQNSAA